MRLAQRKIVVTGGPTREWLDPVRFISNPSSGRMGAALAKAAIRRGRETVFIHGPIHSDVLSGLRCRLVAVESTVDMLEAVLGECEPNAVLIMAAAPADYAPIHKAREKIKKSEERLSIELKKNPDILKEVAARVREGIFPGLVAVGFAAETTDIEAYALAKLEEKNLDMICLNDVSRAGAGFGSETNIITIFFKGGRREDLPLLPKEEAAERIFDEIETWISEEVHS